MLVLFSINLSINSNTKGWKNKGQSYFWSNHQLSAVVKLKSSDDGLEKADLRFEIYSFITNIGIDIQKQYMRIV